MENSTSVAAIAEAIADALCEELSQSLTQQKMSQNSLSITVTVSIETPGPSRPEVCTAPTLYQRVSILGLSR